MTADGKIALPTRAFVPFSSRRDHDHMMELRATADAVMSGARTVELSAATLGTGGAKYRRLRIKRGLSEYNLRIIVSGSARSIQTRKSSSTRFSPIIILTTARAGKRRLEKASRLGRSERFAAERKSTSPLRSAGCAKNGA